MYGEKMSRGEFLRRVLGMGWVATAALFLTTKRRKMTTEQKVEESAG